MDTTATSSHSVSATLPKTADTLESLTSAFSSGTFELTGNVTTGFLHGSMYLVGIAQEIEIGDAEFGRVGFIQAKVGQYFVEAGYSDSQGQWGVDVSLPGISESFFTAGVNNFFTFTIPVTLPMTITIDATSQSGAVAVLIGGEGSASGNVSLSAAAWVTFTPTDTPPLSGDFDGDGDVDGRDFLAWQRGFGADMGATLTQGDADHNGIVDGDDLDVWAANYGSTLAPLSNSTAVPEPSTWMLLLMKVVISFFDCRTTVRHGR